jgi:nucleoside-diphosphate-sugar epimerase
MADGAERPGDELVVITGAAGRLARTVIPLLLRPGRRLRLVDIEPEPPWELPAGCTWRGVDVRDPDALAEAFDGADAIVHLAGRSREASWDDILQVNVDGTRSVLEAAHRHDVKRLLLAGSVHAVGFASARNARAVPPTPSPIPSPAAEMLPPRPDTYYGFSKAAMESLGALYADRYGMTIVTARICTFQPAPRDDGRTPALWLSPGDAARLVEAVLALDDGRHHLVWGVSANATDWFPLDPGRAIGFHPVDDAFAVLRGKGVEPAVPDPDQLLGGAFADLARPLGSVW